MLCRAIALPWNGAALYARIGGKAHIGRGDTVVYFGGGKFMVPKFSQVDDIPGRWVSYMRPGLWNGIDTVVSDSRGKVEIEIRVEKEFVAVGGQGGGGGDTGGARVRKGWTTFEIYNISNGGVLEEVAR